jgi:hypothetical protein
MMELEPLFLVYRMSLLRTVMVMTLFMCCCLSPIHYPTIVNILLFTRNFLNSDSSFIPLPQPRSRRTLSTPRIMPSQCIIAVADVAKKVLNTPRSPNLETEILLERYYFICGTSKLGYHSRISTTSKLNPSVPKKKIT